MKVQEITIHTRLEPQKLSARETPHATIEPNTTCNIRCSSCYCIDEAVMKSLSQVLDEIDLAIAKRNLDAVSLLGGEPTLHPDIVRIVQYVKSKGLVCLLLTNGVRFVRDGDVELLDALVRAGVDRFLVHIDQGQKHVHGDIDLARHVMFDMLDQRRVFYGLSLTLYPGQEDALPAIMRAYARHPYFDGVLCTLSFEIEHAFGEYDRERRTSMAKVFRGISEGLHIEPAAYLPSSTDDDEVCWLMYFYYLNVETGATFELSPEINRGFKALFRKVKGHHFFAETMRPEWIPASLAATAAAEIVLHPSRTLALVHLLQGSHRASALRFHYIVVQQAPLLDRESGRVQICWQCPDATIRNGRLTPVCIAGQVNPLGGRPVTAPPEIVREVLSHLGEIP